MPRFVVFAIAMTSASSWLAAAPVPVEPAALVAGLSNPSAKVRDEAAVALRGRVDALPWLRRAVRSTDKDTARRAAVLVAEYEPKRQAAASKAIDACIRDDQADLFMEWHHYWRPENKDDLWPVGPRMARAGQEEYAKRCLPIDVKRFEDGLNFRRVGVESWFYDGPNLQFNAEPRRFVTWNIRTEQCDRWPIPHVTFASVSGPARLGAPGLLSGRFFVLGSVVANPPVRPAKFVVCDGSFHNWDNDPTWGGTSTAFIACRGEYRGSNVYSSVLLVDGNVELVNDGPGQVKDSLIRASGDIHIPNSIKIINSTIEPNAKHATAPYRFFELSDVGLHVVDDEEGMVVAATAVETPFGASGLRKGDVILAIDDARAGHSEQFRKLVRKAMVVQGDCLITVARGDKTLDIPVFFPLPK